MSQFVFFCCDEQQDQKRLGEEKNLFGLNFQFTIHHRGKPGQELKQSPQKKAAHGIMLS